MKPIGCRRISRFHIFHWQNCSLRRNKRGTAEWSIPRLSHPEDPSVFITRSSGGQPRLSAARNIVRRGPRAKNVGHRRSAVRPRRPAQPISVLKELKDAQQVGWPELNIKQPQRAAAFPKSFAAQELLSPRILEWAAGRTNARCFK